jgi:hypothetical protein
LRAAQRRFSLAGALVQTASISKEKTTRMGGLFFWPKIAISTKVPASLNFVTLKLSSTSQYYYGRVF